MKDRREREPDMTPKQFMLFIGFIAAFAVWAFNCPAIHAQERQEPQERQELQGLQGRGGAEEEEEEEETPSIPITVQSEPIPFRIGGLDDSPFLRRRAMGVTLYCLMLFDRTGATGVHLHNERLVSTFLIDWQDIGVKMVHENVSGCGCEFQIITPLPWWLVQGSHYLVWNVVRPNGQSFQLTIEKVMGWYVEPWR